MTQISSTWLVSIYYYAAAAITFSCLLEVPNVAKPGRPKLTPLDNVLTSLLLAVVLGWLIWPIAVVAWWKIHNAPRT